MSAAPTPGPRLDVEALYAALDRKRRTARIRWKEIAEATGVSASTFTRLGYGDRPDVDNLVRILLWLGTTDIAPFIRQEEQP